MSTVTVNPNRPYSDYVGMAYSHTTDSGTVLEGVTDLDSDGRLVVRFPEGRWAFCSFDFAV